MAKNQTKKTPDEHSEDALYREVWEDVRSQKTMEFFQRHLKAVIIISAAIVLAVVAFTTIRHIRYKNMQEITRRYESAMAMEPANARVALDRIAADTHSGMGDMAMWKSYQLAYQAGDRADAIAKLKLLVSKGKNRDIKEMAILQLAMLADMTGNDMQKLLSPLLSKRSPFYFSGMLLIAEKYLSENNSAAAVPYLQKIMEDKDAPATILGAATMLAQ